MSTQPSVGGIRTSTNLGGVSRPDFTAVATPNLVPLPGSSGGALNTATACTSGHEEPAGYTIASRSDAPRLEPSQYF